jgi:hypothetical protein
LLVVENEQCLHQLPVAAGTVAALGAGLNLAWLGAPWLAHKNLGYWGDIDTWGLTMLAHAKKHQPQLTALLMSQAIFNPLAAQSAVTEPEPAATPPAQLASLSPSEQTLYQQLRQSERGRLEQEFIPTNCGTQCCWRLGRESL